MPKYAQHKRLRPVTAGFAPNQQPKWCTAQQRLAGTSSNYYEKTNKAGIGIIFHMEKL
jgi:hypothetical protein